LDIERIVDTNPVQGIGIGYAVPQPWAIVAGYIETILIVVMRNTVYEVCGAVAAVESVGAIVRFTL
jgi:hypothetical protein